MDEMFLLGRNDVDGSSVQYGVFSSLRLAIDKLRYHYIITGQTLDIIGYPLDILCNSTQVYDLRVYYGDKYINKHIQGIRKNVEQAQRDEYMRHYGVTEDGDIAKALSSMIDTALQLTVAGYVVSLVDTTTEDRTLAGIEAIV